MEFTEDKLDAWFEGLQENRKPFQLLPPMSADSLEALYRIRRINEELAQHRLEEEQARLAAEAEAENAEVTAVEKDNAHKDGCEEDDEDDIPVVKSVASSQVGKGALFVPIKKDADESLFTKFA